MLTFKDLAEIVNGQVLKQTYPDKSVEFLLTDSRKLTPVGTSLFVAIRGQRHDGHNFIQPLLDSGVCQFIIDQDIGIPSEDINVLKVKDSLAALQQLAAYKRTMFDIPIVGITGSNGKTIVKEWLAQLLEPYKSIVKSPGSYNSQLGVPLSVWGISANHQLAIFEAGISQPGEMQELQKIIRPTVGVFTNIGTAHDEGFESLEQKVKEKALLFQDCNTVIYCKDHPMIDKHLATKSFTWGRHPDSDVRIVNQVLSGHSTELGLVFKGISYSLTLPFLSQASIDNAMHCISFMMLQNFEPADIQCGISQLKTVPMRLELKRGINNCLVIDDTYNSDLGGLQVALDFLVSQKQLTHKTVIISDMQQTGMAKALLYKSVFEQIKAANPDAVIAIGTDVSQHLQGKSGITCYKNTDEFLSTHDFYTFEKSLVLVKGARIFQFEKIVSRLEEKIHGTHLEINLDALTHNLNYYRSKLSPGTKLMVMVKAFAYGSGSLEIANLLQHHRVDYLGVAYADEGVALRTNGIQIPIMVMNPSPESFAKIMEYKLEPELYNTSILSKFLHFVGDKPAPVHLKLDTGMHRLGFSSEEIPELVDLLKNSNVEVKSIFSHLAGADESTHNEFSEEQAEAFVKMGEKLKNALGIKPILHLLNSPGIVRFPQYHFDMVRLGIGLYGIEATNKEQHKLEAISTLKTIVSQVNYLKRGETVGYSRKGKVENDMTVATIAIGYADGFSRAFSNGVGKVVIHGQQAPVVGNVCMDMTMVDVSHIPGVTAGDEVEVFGQNLTISEMAGFINTIPYEILTNVSQRIKRIYYSG